MCGTPGVWRKLGRGEVVMKIVVRWGICVFVGFVN
jgi:hypothetical protein